MAACLRMLEEERETEMDALLVMQLKCQIIANQLSCPLVDGLEENGNSKPPSSALVTALLHQLDDMQQRLPAHIQSNSSNPHVSLKIYEYMKPNSY
jgi:hypothetical protein